MSIDKLHETIGEWMTSRGPDSDVVMSTRIRLARNLVEFPFMTKATPRQRTEIERHVRERLLGTEVGKPLFYANLQDASPIDRTLLVERHLISKDHASAQGDRGVAFGPNEVVSIMVNEEDHLRLQVLRSGFVCREAWDEMARLDEGLEGDLNYAFDEQFGYLTACPTNVGTALRVSVMLHLPALVMTKQIEKVFQAVSKISLAVRGFYGEGTQASGDFYQISNQVTLGRSEEEIIGTVTDVVPQIVKYERKVRSTLLEENRIPLEDRVRRAFGILCEVRTITSEEVMDLLSAVRLGVNLGLIPEIGIDVVNELFIKTQPAHLQKIEGKKLDTPERDSIRANYIRKRLAEVRSN